MLTQAAASNRQTPEANPAIQLQHAAETPNLPLSRVAENLTLNLKDPPTLDPLTAAALQNPQAWAQQLAVLAQKAKTPLTLEVKETARLQQDQPPRRFQIVQESFAKALFNAGADPLATARIPTHKDALARAQNEWVRQHPNNMPPQEAELIGKGYVAKAQAELISRENVKAQQINTSVGSLRNQLHAFGYTVIAAQ